jgi:hypothetical protein
MFRATSAALVPACAHLAACVVLAAGSARADRPIEFVIWGVWNPHASRNDLDELKRRHAAAKLAPREFVGHGGQLALELGVVSLEP